MRITKEDIAVIAIFMVNGILLSAVLVAGYLLAMGLSVRIQ